MASDLKLWLIVGKERMRNTNFVLPKTPILFTASLSAASYASIGNS